MIKTHNTNGMLPIPTAVIKDRSLSLADKALYGIIAYHTQLPGFKLNRNYLCSRYGIGQYALKSCMSILQDKGYAFCDRVNGQWVYRTACDDKHYTPIAMTILSSDLSLKDIGLYLIIAYAITLPNVKLSLDLYASYCRDCKKTCMATSKRLQLAGLYEQHKVTTCNYTYTLNILHPDGSYTSYATALPPLSAKNKKGRKPKEHKLQETPAAMQHHDKSVHAPSPDPTRLSIKDLLFYEHDAKTDFYTDFREGCTAELKKAAYDTLLSAISYAQKAKYIKINGIKMHYEKFYDTYVSKLGDRSIREQIVKQIIDSVNGSTTIHNLDLYICGLIGKAVPLAILSDKRNNYSQYSETASLFGQAAANDDYTNYRKYGFHYAYMNGSFIRFTGACCA